MSVVAWLYPKRTRVQREVFMHMLYADDGELTRHGEVLLAWLRDFAGLYDNRIRLDSLGRVDPIATAFEAGKREVALQFTKIANLREQDIRGATHDDSEGIEL